MAFAMAFAGPFRTPLQVVKMAELAEHVPVMLDEVLDVLPLAPGGVAVDGTLGLGGHSAKMAERIAPGGVLVGADWDETMLAKARTRLECIPGIEAKLYHDDFRRLGDILDEAGLKADGVLLDLGLNSAQIEDPSRGISFLADGPLDMRMDRSRGEPAAALLNRLSLKQIEQVLWDNGGERWASAIARVVIRRRADEPFRTTRQLVEAVLAAVPVKARDKRIHPATRTFQALRIAVNGELEGLDDALEASANALKDGGVLAVLSYHSGEDRIVKLTFKRLVKTGLFADVYKKPLQPSEEEVRRNPRSRSAKLRALRRVVAMDRDA